MGALGRRAGDAHTDRVGLPPGSRLPAVVQTGMILHDPIAFFNRNRMAFGPVFRARLVGVPKIVYVGTPALADLVLRTDRDIGEAGTARRDFLEPLVGPQSVLCLEGEQWLRERRRLAPAFHGEQVRRWGDTLAEIVAAEVAEWPLGESFALRPRMQRVTLEVILRLVFGLDAAGRRDPVHERLREVLPRLIDVGATRALAFLPLSVAERVGQSALARRFPGNPVTTFTRTRAAADELLYEEIARRRAAGHAGGNDVLSLLIACGSTDDQIRDELITLLEAGHETTATGTAWMFERLLRTPTVMQRVREAIANGDDIYLDAVVKEALRVRPVVLDAPRMLTAPLRLGGYEVPAGWLAAPVIPLVHTDPMAYPDADRFRPERFLEDQRPSGSWIPFGGGRRLCLGIQLALLEMRVVLAEVLRRVSLQPVDPAPERPKLRGVTLIPEHLTLVTAHAVTSTISIS
jgi:cytochrome P450 family 135